MTAVLPVQQRQDKLGEKVDNMSKQLNEVKQSVELLVSRWWCQKWGEDDKCKDDPMLRQHDDAGDGRHKWGRSNTDGRYKGDEIGSSGAVDKAPTQSGQGREEEWEEWWRHMSWPLRKTTMSKQTLTITNIDEAPQDRVINTDAELGQFMQILKLKGRKTNLYYKDSIIQKFDDKVAKRMFQKENLGFDLEQEREMEEDFNLFKEQGVTDVAQPEIQELVKKKTLRPREKRHS